MPQRTRQRQRQEAQRHRERQADDLAALQLLKDDELAPSAEQAELLRVRFDRIFKRAGAGFATLDGLLRRLHRNEDGPPRVLERPEIPLDASASENDIRAFVTNRKNLGRNRQRQGPRRARRHAGAGQNQHEA